jgi:hypothetical protein
MFYRSFAADNCLVLWNGGEAGGSHNASLVFLTTMSEAFTSSQAKLDKDLLVTC